MILAEPLRSVAGSVTNVRLRVHPETLLRVAGVAAILGVIALAYGRILDDWFVSDDFWYLRASQVASPDYVLNSFDYTAYGPVPEVMYRPLYPVVFLFTYNLFGLHAWLYHWLSIVLHAANTVLVFLVARKLTRRDAAAYIAAFVFGLHPSYAPAVAWITSNVSVFSTLFSMSALLLFLNYLDGGPRRAASYFSSFALILVAVLIHPESIVVIGVMGLSHLFSNVRRLEDLRSPRLYAPLVPHAFVAIAMLGLLQYVRNQDYYQQLVFGLGGHMVDSYVIYMANLGNPFGYYGLTTHDWRPAVPAAGVGLLATWLVVACRSFELRTRLLVAAWLACAILPLTTFIPGVQTRKLYVAGPPFALLFAMASVATWDLLAPRLPSFRVLSFDLRYAPAAAFLVVVAFFLPFRTWQVTDRPHMARATLTSADSYTYKALVDTVRGRYPSLPEGARLDLAEVPWNLRVGATHIFGPGGLDTRVIDALRIHYGYIEVYGYAHRDALPPVETHDHYQVVLSCPPVCGPPLPRWLRDAIREGRQQQHQQQADGP